MASDDTGSPLPITHTSTITPDQIDELGHMNVRWYGHNATAATKEFARRLHLEAPVVRSAYTRHHHEQLEGGSLEVASGVLGGSDRLRFYHELRNSADGELAATFVHEVDSPALETTPIALPGHGAPRSIRLDSDGLDAAPSLAEVRLRDLAIRHEREVTTEDSMGAEVVPSWLTNNLIWGGERPDGDDDWIHTTADGDRVAFATMESRLWAGTPATVGTRIQSFGAAVALGDKIKHSLHWCYDVSTEQPIAVFEVINLAFSISQRRSVLIPPAVREQDAARLHPDLAIP